MSFDERDPNLRAMYGCADSYHSPKQMPIPVGAALLKGSALILRPFFAIKDQFLPDRSSETETLRGRQQHPMDPTERPL